MTANRSGGARSHFERDRIIADSNLPAVSKSVLTAFMLYMNAAAEAWPSHETIAADSGLAVRTVVKHMSTLRSLGIVCDEGHGRRGTRIVRIDFNRLSQLARPGTRTADRSARGAPDCSPGADAHRSSSSPTCAPRADKPSIQPSKEQTTEPLDRPELRIDSCMDGPIAGYSLTAAAATTSVRTALMAAGVQGPILERLCSHPELTAEEVSDELTAIRGQQGIRKPAAVLATRLAQRHGIEIPRGKKLGIKAEGVVKRIDFLRQERGIPRSMQQ